MYTKVSTLSISNSPLQIDPMSLNGRMWGAISGRRETLGENVQFNSHLLSAAIAEFSSLFADIISVDSRPRYSKVEVKRKWRQRIQICPGLLSSEARARLPVHWWPRWWQVFIFSGWPTLRFHLWVSQNSLYRMEKRDLWQVHANNVVHLSHCIRS